MSTNDKLLSRLVTLTLQLATIMQTYAEEKGDEAVAEVLDDLMITVLAVAPPAE